MWKLKALQVWINQENIDGNKKAAKDPDFRTKVDVTFYCKQCDNIIGVFPDVQLPSWMGMAHFILNEYLTQHYGHTNPRQSTALNDNRSMEIKMAINSDSSKHSKHSMKKFTECTAYLSLYLSEAVWTLDEAASS